MIDEERYRSPLTAGGLVGCAMTLPFYFFALVFVEEALHSDMPWSHWVVFWIAVIAVPAAILVAVRWCVDRLMAPRP
jgi:hypothetical protein